MNIRAIKDDAIEKLKNRWGLAILVVLIYSAIIMVTEAVSYSQFVMLSFVASVAIVFISGPLEFGITSIFLKYSRRQQTKVGDLFKGFSENMWRNVGAWAIMSVFIFLWSLLFIIPGIIALYSYSMTYYILKDNPNIGSNAAIEKSKEMMNGHKAELFRLDLSFIGWYLLAILTLGIGFLWLIPYMQTARAKFYEELVGGQLPNQSEQGENAQIFQPLIKNEAEVAPFKESADAEIKEEEAKENPNEVYMLKCEVCGARETHNEKTATCTYCGGQMK